MAEAIQDANTVVNEEDSEQLTIDILDPTTVSKSTYKDIQNICPTMTTEPRRQIMNLIKSYSTTFSDIPGQSKTVIHHIRLVSDIPIRVKPNVISVNFKQKVETEI